MNAMATHTSEPANGRSELLERVEAILPLLAENADRAERERDLPRVCFDALVDSGALRLFAPRRVGGLEAGYRSYVEVTLRLATACGSSAWLAFILNHGDWHVGQMGGAVQERVWADGASGKVAVPLTPAPGWRAERDGDATVLSGAWPYSSGSTHARWILAGFPLLDDTGQPYDNAVGLVDTQDADIRDSWQVSGLAATGSNTYLLDGVRVPDDHTISFRELIGHQFRTPYPQESQYHQDVGTIFHLATLIPVIGLARAALELTLEKITATPRPMSYTFYADTTKSPATQSAMAKAAWNVDTALEQARATADAIDAQAQTAKPFGPNDRARFAMRAAQGHRLCREAVDLLLDVQGAGSFALSNPLQRLWRDLHIASRHGMSVPGLKEELYGRALLGAEEQHMTPLV